MLERGSGRGKILYLDLQSGIAGDMTLAGLFDLGVPEEVVTDAISALGLREVSLCVESGYAGAIGCTHVDVVFPPQSSERSYAEIVELISAASLSESVQRLSLSIFERLARAEARVHQTELSNVHFHEVGSLDAIVDIVGSAAAFDYLGAQVVASPVPLGRGFVECRHGVLPLPAPATLHCLEGIPTMSSGLSTELVTPTGAAILATVATRYSEWPHFVIERIGWGAGTRGLPDRPNAVRMVLGTEVTPAAYLSHALLEANVDDMTGEVVAHALERILEGGALDVWVVPATMKKGRPALVLSALCRREDSTRVAGLLLRETTTIGVRQTLVSRTELAREVIEVETAYGKVRVKVSGAGTEAQTIKPELDDCVKLAQKAEVPLWVVLEAARVAFSSTR